MTPFSRQIALHSLVAVGLLFAMTTAHAHLIVEQRGTINFKNGGAFIVVSIPVSAFDGIDDNGDGAVSATELDRHTTSIQQQVYDGIRLSDESRTLLPLQGLLLSLSQPHDDPRGPASHLIALGRFAVDDLGAPLGLQISLHGDKGKEQRIQMTVTRKGQSRDIVFTPQVPFHRI